MRLGDCGSGGCSEGGPRAPCGDDARLARLPGKDVPSERLTAIGCLLCSAVHLPSYVNGGSRSQVTTHATQGREQHSCPKEEGAACH